MLCVHFFIKVAKQGMLKIINKQKENPVFSCYVSKL